MKQLFLFVAFVFCWNILPSQSFADRFLLQTGAAIHGSSNLEPGTLSFTFQPSIKINNLVSVALRYDAHLFQFGKSGPKNYWISNSPTNYLIRDSYLKGLSSIAIIPHLHAPILNTSILLGLGVGYYDRKEIYTRIYSLNNNSFLPEYYPHEKSIGLMFTSSVNFEKINIGIIWNYIDNINVLSNTNGMASVFLNYALLGGENIRDKGQSRITDLPVFMIGFGIQPMGNLGKYAGAFRIYIEPKFAIGNTISVGFRVNSNDAAGVGFDKKSEYYFEDGLKWHKTKIMKNVFSRLGTAYYYFPQKTGWYFLNMGFGEYIRNEISGISAKDELGQTLVIPSMPRQKNKGGFLGTGIKTGIFRFSLEYNFTGKNIPDYLAAQIGLEVNFFNTEE